MLQMNTPNTPAETAAQLCWESAWPRHWNIGPFWINLLGPSQII